MRQTIYMLLCILVGCGIIGCKSKKHLVGEENKPVLKPIMRPTSGGLRQSLVLYSQWKNDYIDNYDHQHRAEQVMYVDIDGDGLEEIYLRDTVNADYGIFTFAEGKTEEVTQGTYKSWVDLYEGVVKRNISIGTGVMAADYYRISMSRVIFHLHEYIEAPTPETTKVEYTCDGKPYNTADAKAFIDGLTPLTPTVSWRNIGKRPLRINPLQELDSIPELDILERE